MDDFVWQESYRIDKTIDTEHRHLFALANQVVHFRARGERAALVREAVIELYEYVKTHFAHEESRMAQADYPGLPAHRVLHGAIIYEMNEIVRGATDLDALVHNLKRLMTTWVVHHIQEADRQLGDFLRNRPPAAAPASDT